jgi:hypothetical protein
LNQESTLKRAGDTRWGSHYGTLLSLSGLFSPVIDVLEVIAEDATYTDQRNEASKLLYDMQCFEFVFMLHLMKQVLGITNALSQALQRKDQDIVNAMQLVQVSKERLQELRVRDDEWELLLNNVSVFCKKHEIVIINMEDKFELRGRSRRKSPQITNLHYYRFEVFNTVIDMQLRELNDRFNKQNMELLLCMACLDPRNAFDAFNKSKLIYFAEFYPSDFSAIDLLELDDQLEIYIRDMRSNSDFSEVVGIGGLAQKMVEKDKHIVYPLVYSLVKLSLILPVATATVERVFSGMNLIKTSLRNRMGDEFMNDCLVTYIEREIFKSVSVEKIMLHFQNMKKRKGVL